MLKLGSLKLNPGAPHIAVPFTDTMIPADFVEAKKTGLDIAEARIDLFRSFAAKHVVKTIASFKNFPTIATIRTKKEGGGWAGSEAARQNLFATVMPYVDAIDIELSSAATLAKIARLAKKRGKMLIVSYHNFDGTPKLASLKYIVKQAEKAGADIVKIAAHVAKAEDTITLASLLLQGHRNLIVIGMGRKGVTSRLLFPRFGSLLTFASYGDAATAPGQVPLEKMTLLLKSIYPGYR